MILIEDEDNIPRFLHVVNLKKKRSRIYCVKLSFSCF